jgi:prolyl 4-hydroxylase
MSTDASQPVVQCEQISQSPSAWLLRDFLTDEECAHLIRLGEDKLKPSLTVDAETGEHVQVESRTSFLTFLTLRADPIVATIEQKISDLLGIPVENGEGLQLLRYQIGQEYKPHFDAFDAKTPGGLKALEKGGQRVITILLYLSDVEAGGDTIFPTVNLKIRPQKRHGLLFYSLYDNGETDPNSLHGSEPVIQGEKWVATKWLRQRQYT